MSFIFVLDEKIKAVAPIDGIGVGRFEDKSTWRIDFKDEATQTERVAAQAVVDGFDVAAEEQKIKDKTLSDKAKKDTLLGSPNKNVTIQDLIDLGIIS